MRFFAALALMLGLISASFAINVNNCTLISSPGSYQLISNIQGAPVFGPPETSNCIEITANDVDFTCNGYKITNNGTAGNTVGIAIVSVTSNVTVRDCNPVSNYYRGIFTTLSGGVTVRNSTVYNTSDMGLILFISSNSNYSNNTIYNCGNDGIHLNYVNNSVVRNCRTYNNTVHGIANFNSLNNTLAGNWMYNNTLGISLWLSSSYNITDNTASLNRDTGIRLDNASNYTSISNNSAYNNAARGFDLLSGSSYNALANNTGYSNAGSGFLVYSNSNYNNLTNNSAVNNSQAGFALDSSFGNSIINGTAQDNNWYDVLIGDRYGGVSSDAQCNNVVQGINGTFGFPILYANSSVVWGNMTVAEAILCNADNSVVRNLSVVGNDALGNNAFIIERTDYAVIANSNSSNHNTGFRITAMSSNNLIENCSAPYNYNGFSVDAGADSNVFRNDVAVGHPNTGGIWDGKGACYWLSANYTVLINSTSIGCFRGFRVAWIGGLTNFTNCTARDGITTGSGPGEGFFISGSGCNLAGNVAYNNTGAGFYLWPNPSGPNNPTNDNILLANTAYNNSAGLRVRDSNRTTISGMHLYRNSVDFNISAETVSGLTFSSSGMVFDNPVGNYTNYTNLSISDSLASEAYLINWSINNSALPTGRISFANKYVNITPLLGSPSIGSVTWRWSDSELPGYNENNFELWKSNTSGWGNTGAALDSGANTLTLANLNPASTYGIMQASTSSFNENSETSNLLEWRMFHRYLNHTAWDGVAFPAAALSGIPRFLTGSYVESSPAIANGFVYVGSFDYGVYQLNASNVSQKIANFTTGNSVYSSPVVVNGFVYIGSDDGNVYQLNASNISQKIANFSTAGIIAFSSPAIANGFVYIGSDDGNLYQLNASNVSQKIANYSTGSAYSSPAVANGCVYVGGGNSVYQLNASNISQKMANYTTGNIVVSSPAVANGSVYIGSYDRNIYQLNASNISQKIANFSTGDIIYAVTPAVANGYVYIGSDDRQVYQLNASNISQKIANYSTGGKIESSAAVANGFVYVGSNDNQTYQLNASNISQKIANYTTGSFVLSSPAVAGGFVYIGSDDQYLYQLNASNISQAFVGGGGGGTPVSSCQVISSPGSYRLSNSVYGSPIFNNFTFGYSQGAIVWSCLLINTSNVLFDCGGYNVANNGTHAFPFTWSAGFLVAGRTNVTIQNCPMISSFYTAFYTYYSNYLTVRNAYGWNESNSGLLVDHGNSSTIINVTMNKTNVGFPIYYSYHDNVTGNSAYNQSGGGFNSQNGGNNTFRNNTAAMQQVGMSFADLGNDTIDCNRAFNHSSRGMSVGGDNNIITNNRVYDTIDKTLVDGEGFIVGGNNITVVNNTAYNNSQSCFSTYATAGNFSNNTAYLCYNGFSLQGATYNLFVNNTVSNNTYGFFLYTGAYNNTLINNTAYWNYEGMFLWNTINNAVFGNSAYNNSQSGFTFMGSASNNMGHQAENNTALNNTRGFYINYAKYSNFTNNTALNNSYYGFDVSFSYNNTLGNNTAQDNVRYDLNFAASLPQYCNNTIYGMMGSGGRPINYTNGSVSWNGFNASEIILCNADFASVSNATVRGSPLFRNNGVLIIQTDNATVSGINSSGNYQGFSIYTSFTDNLSYCTADNNRYAGFYIETDSEINLLSNCSARGNGQRGFDLEGGFYHRLYGCNASNNTGTGFYNIGDYANFSGCAANNNSQQGFENYGDYNVLDNASAGSNVRNGFWISAYHNIVSNYTGFGNAQAGYFCSWAYGNNVSKARLYGNGLDLVVNNSAGSAFPINMSGLVFDNPSGGLANYSNISLDTSVAGNTAFSVSWSQGQAPLPVGLMNFSNKFANISAIRGNVSIARARWHWQDSELAGYDETLFRLWKYNASGWLDQNATLDTAANTLNLTNMSLGSVYGILQNSTNATPYVLSVNLQSPAEASSFNYSAIQFNYSAISSTNATFNCSLFLDGVFNQSTSSYLNGSNASFAATLAESRHNWNIQCNDSVTGNTSETRNLTIDLTLPSITLNSPPEGNITQVTSAAFNFTAVDNLASQLSCGLYIDGNLSLANSSVVNNTPTVLRQNLTAGAHTWFIRCNDSAGNSNSSAIRNITFSQFGPNIMLNAPANGATIQSSVPINVTFNFSVTDDLSSSTNCTVYIDGAFNRTTGIILNGSSFQFSVQMSVSSHDWAVECQDTSGNLNTSPTFAFYVSLPAPLSQPPSGGGGAQPSSMTLSYSRSACPDNSVTIAASSGSGTDIRLVLYDPYEGTVAKATGSSATFTLNRNGTYQAYGSKSGYNPGSATFNYETCAVSAPEANVTPPVQPPAPPSGPTTPPVAQQNCTTDSECPDTYFCDNSTGLGTCKPVTGECGYASNHVFIAYECCSDPDCTGGKLCQSNACRTFLLTGDSSGTVGGNGTFRVTVDGQPFANAELEITKPDGTTQRFIAGSNGELSLPYENQGDYKVGLVHGGVVVNTHVVAVAALPAPTVPPSRATLLDEAKKYWWVLLVIAAIVVGYATYRVLAGGKRKGR